MRVVVIRHGKVLHKWEKRCTSADIQTVYISTLDRTLQTAKRIFGDFDFRITSTLNEVPLRSGFDTSIMFSLWFWNALGRIQWITGKKDNLRIVNRPIIEQISL